MPLYEYVCRDCDRRFEAFVTADRIPSCPSCHTSEGLEKQLSVFAVSTGSAERSGASFTAPCGSCGDPRGAGACSLN
jgi:putative FmdB family regulatory protein